MAKPLIELIPGVNFFPTDDKGRHKGLLGLIRLYFDLRKENKWDGIVDLHDVLRTKILRFFYSFTNVPVGIIDKGRSEKRKLTRKSNKIIKPLLHTIDRYSRAFNALGFVFKVDFESIYTSKPLLPELFRDNFGGINNILIGFAPFAKHKGKTYPIDLVKETLRKLSRIENSTIILFGGGTEEKRQLENLAKEYKNVISVASRLTLAEELAIMANLKVMISMDSANMHLASLVGTRVVSIWGATHPYAGFYGWNQSPNNAIQIDSLSCRPCSVFGDKPCFRKDYACLNQIDPEFVVKKVKELISS
jgi:ADP-heptose:LPS heptosyltransferase